MVDVDVLLRSTALLGYSRIELPVSACVHFVHNDEVDYDDLCEIVARARSKGIICAYLDYEDMREGPQHLRDYIARILNLANPPYEGASNPWIPFLDDLITLSGRVSGMALVVDNAESLLREDPRNLFELVEVFLMQFRHWFEKSKPCHLCFQLERSEVVRQVFAGSPSSA